jgi:hypothetical protein
MRSNRTFTASRRIACRAPQRARREIEPRKPGDLAAVVSTNGDRGAAFRCERRLRLWRLRVEVERNRQDREDGNAGSSGHLALRRWTRRRNILCGRPASREMGMLIT